MIASRFHSARRNKRWQVATVAGLASLLGAWWLWSGNTLWLMRPISGHVLVVSAHSQALIVYCEKGNHYPSMTEWGKDDYSYSPLLLPWFQIQSGQLSLEIPLWNLVMLFLIIQYLLLPKSLPVTEENQDHHPMS